MRCMRISRNTERRKRRRTSAGCRQSADGRVAVLRLPLAEMGRGVRSCCTKRAMTGSPGRGKMPATRDRYRHSHPPTVGLYAYIAGPARWLKSFCPNKVEHARALLLGGALFTRVRGREVCELCLRYPGYTACVEAR